MLAGGAAAALWRPGRLSASRPRSPASGESLPDGILVKVLGTAQDGGVPQLGCDCPNCVRARRDPSSVRWAASLAAIDFRERTFFLVDATPDMRLQTGLVRDRLARAAGTAPASPAGVVLTHAHMGHYTGLMFFGYESASTRRLPVFATERMRAFLASNAPWSRLLSQDNIALKPLTPGESAALSPRLSVRPFRVPHRDELSDTVGLVLSGPRRSLLYIPDIQSWDAWSRPVREAVSAVDVSLLDGTFFDRNELPGRDLAEIGHPLITDSLARLAGLPAEKRAGLRFIHLNHSNPVLDPSGPARRAVESAGLRIAEEGEEFEI